MAGGKLEVQIGADITDFEKKIKEVEFDIKELSKVKLDQLKLGLDTREINAQIKDAKNNLTTLKTTVKDTGNSFTGMTPKVANGGNALMQFSRIAQDAPYGIIGIGNNITATAEAFSYLKQSTGSTGGALKALASSLMGTGGILLGVSLLTTGFTLLSQSGLSVGDVVDKITGKFDAAGAELQKLNEEANKSAGKEIANMKALVSVAQDETLSKEKRLIAVRELQKEFPAYFGNLSQEKILTGELTSVTNSLSTAILERARATVYAGKLGELIGEELTLNGKLIKAKQDLAKADKIVQEQYNRTKNASDEVRASQTNAFDAINANNLRNTVKEIREEIIKNKKAQDTYTDATEKSTKASILLKQEVAKPIKTYNTPQVSGLGANIVPAPLVDVNGIAVFNGQIDALGNKVKELPGVISASLAMLPEKVSASLVATTMALNEFNDRANQIIQGAMVDTFAGIGTAIGNALANGGSVLGSIGASLLDSLGGLLVQMGRMAIEIGVGLIAVKTALKSLNPYVAIAAGVGLVALGSMFSSKSKSIGGSIGGGGGGASSSTGSGANNQSFSSGGFSGGSNSGGTVVFEIAGQKLVGVLSNTLNANRRLGGQLAL